MTATILEGHGLADRMLADTRAEVDALTAARGRRPRLAILMAGRNPGAVAYAERQGQFAARAGIEAAPHHLDPEGDLAAALALIEMLNRDPAVDGVMPLFPFPAHISPLAIAAAIDPAKDVDGLSPLSAGRLALGLDGHRPCTPQGALALAEWAIGPLRGRTATVVGASISVGKPLAQLLLQREATVTIAHAATADLAAACRTAEVLFVAVGRAGLITADHVRPGALVVDIGINVIVGPDGGTRIAGDVDLASVSPVAAMITAAPDGVGPLTTAFLMANTLAAYRGG